MRRTIRKPPPKTKNPLEAMLDDVESAVAGSVEDKCKMNFCGACPSPDMYPMSKEEMAEGPYPPAYTISNFEQSMLTEFTTATSKTGMGYSESRSDDNMSETSETTGPYSPAARTGVDEIDKSAVTIVMPNSLKTVRRGKSKLVIEILNDEPLDSCKEAKSPFSLAGSQSATGMSLTESFSYDGMPPPVTLQSSVDEKGDDELCLEQRLAELNRQVAESPSKGLLHFAPRPGKSFFWRNVSMVVAAPDDTELQHKVLNNVFGEVPEYQTTALIGARGAG